jgi:hypothetical protein
MITTPFLVATPGAYHFLLLLPRTPLSTPLFLIVPFFNFIAFFNIIKIAPPHWLVAAGVKKLPSAAVAITTTTATFNTTTAFTAILTTAAAETGQTAKRRYR